MKNDNYDHHAAIYYLLLDKVKQHRSNYGIQDKNPIDTKRRPSTIAEQAMRKMAGPVVSTGALPVGNGGHPAVNRHASLGCQSRPPTVTSPKVGGFGGPPCPNMDSVSEQMFSSPCSIHSQATYKLWDVESTNDGSTIPPARVTVVATSIDEGVEADINESSLHSIPTTHTPLPSSSIYTDKHRHHNHTDQHAWREVTQMSRMSDSPLGSTASSTGSTFESFDSQIEPDITLSLPSCTQDVGKCVMNNGSGNQDDELCSAKGDILQTVAGMGTYEMDGNWPASLSPHSTVNHAAYCHNPADAERNTTRSPVNFREGRRASDGLVAQGVIAFRQRLRDTEKVGGLMELNLLKQEHHHLQALYKSNVTQEELAHCQLQHSQFSHYHRNGLSASKLISQSETNERLPTPLAKRISLPESVTSPIQKIILGKCATVSGNGNCNDTMDENSSLNQGKPLQQQLLQHRLQQKRQILQKQSALQRQPPHSGDHQLLKRQMVRQASYKLAQQQTVMPPLPTEVTNAFGTLTDASQFCSQSRRQQLDVGACGVVPSSSLLTSGISNSRPSSPWQLLAPELTPSLLSTSCCSSQWQGHQHHLPLGEHSWSQLPNTLEACHIGEVKEMNQAASLTSAHMNEVKSNSSSSQTSEPTSWLQVPSLVYDTVTMMQPPPSHFTTPSLTCEVLKPTREIASPNTAVFPWQPTGLQGLGVSPSIMQPVSESPFLELAEQMETI